MHIGTYTVSDHREQRNNIVILVEEIFVVIIELVARHLDKSVDLLLVLQVRLYSRIPSSPDSS